MRDPEPSFALHEHEDYNCLCGGDGIFMHEHVSAGSQHGHICVCEAGRHVRGEIRRGLRAKGRPWSEVKKELGL